MARAGSFRSGLSEVALRQNEAFAANFRAAGASCSTRPVLPGQVLPKLHEMTPAEVEQISGRLAEVKRSYHDFGEEPVDESVTARPRRLSEHERSPNRGAQRHFSEIDAGRLEAQSVFSKISGADHRLEVKLHYFRDRSDLVLPIIEDRYVTHDAQRDCFVLDLPLLQRSREPGSTRSSQSSRAVETAEQRSLRLMRSARVRDERIESARQSVKLGELEWRLNHFQCNRQKQRRKQVASSQRILFTWMVLSAVTKRWQDELLRSRWTRAARSQHFGDHYANRSKAHWLRAKNLVHQSLGDNRHMKDLRTVLALRASRSKAAWQRWDRLCRIVKFISRLKVKLRFNRAATAIKQFIESSWRGMHFRSKVGVYLANVRVLQRCVRAAHRFRQNLKLFVVSPHVWELETQLLGEKLKAHLPKDYTKQKIQQHRQAWDLEGRVRVLQEMSKERQLKGLKGPIGEKRRQALAKAKEKKDRRRRGAVRVGMYNERHVIFSELGEAISGTAADRKQQQAWKVANNVLDHYRLDAETRRQVVKVSFHQALERWKNAHRKFRKEQGKLNVLWQQWRLEIQALGKTQKEHWPAPPPHLEPPSELYRVDTKKMTSLIIAGLSQTALGRSLFARDIRDLRARPDTSGQ